MMVCLGRKEVGLWEQVRLVQVVPLVVRRLQCSAPSTAWCFLVLPFDWFGQSLNSLSRCWTCWWRWLHLGLLSWTSPIHKAVPLECTACNTNVHDTLFDHVLPYSSEVSLKRKLVLYTTHTTLSNIGKRLWFQGLSLLSWRWFNLIIVQVAQRASWRSCGKTVDSGRSIGVLILHEQDSMLYIDADTFNCSWRTGVCFYDCSDY